MIEFLSLKPEAFGLDISDLSLRIAKLKKRGKFFRLVSWGEAKIRPGIIEQGEIKDEDVLSGIIKQTLIKVKGERIKTKYLIASLPEKKAFLQVIKMPKMKEEELKTSVPFEAENYIPLPIEKVYLDFQIVSSSNQIDHLDILIAALPKKIVDPYASCFKKAGLIPMALEVESQSIVRAVVKNEISPFPLLIIDLGRSTTSFIVFSGYSPRFTSSVSISSQELTEAISKTLKLSLNEAEKLKLKHGLKDEKALKAMTPLLIDLMGQAKKCIDYHHSHNGGIKKILLCGNGANLKGLSAFVSSELKITVELANPWMNILPSSLKEVPGLSFKESLGYTTALGLALRGIKK